jgi:hypothetical protein
MARVYSDVNATLGPSWYDYGEFCFLIVYLFEVDILFIIGLSLQTTPGLTGVRQSDMRLYGGWGVENTQKCVMPSPILRNAAPTSAG